MGRTFSFRVKNRRLGQVAAIVRGAGEVQDRPDRYRQVLAERATGEDAVAAAVRAKDALRREGKAMKTASHTSTLQFREEQLFIVEIGETYITPVGLLKGLPEGFERRGPAEAAR